MKKYKIAYATGSRADYGIVRRYLKLLNEDPEIELSVLVTGAHLEEKYGMTVKNIEEDGFTVEARIPLQIDNSNTAGILKSMAVALDSFGEFFNTHAYDLLILLGDRYEMMAVATAAAMQTVSILHLHGGEITYGNYDEFIRHCITKMSTYHFTATPRYRDRVIQLGESPDRVFFLGALGAENCGEICLQRVDPRVKELEEVPYFVIAFHPETTTGRNLSDQLSQLLLALEHYADTYAMVFIGTNADTGSDVIRSAWKGFAQEYPNALYFENLNSDSFLHLTANAIALVGNSSAGIIEAPSLGTYTVNIGSRQEGRERADSVLDVECSCDPIRQAMETAIRRKLEGRPIYNPYYLPDAAQQYCLTTKNILKQKKLAWKTFYDLP